MKYVEKVLRDIEANFRHWIDKEEWFYLQLKNKFIDYWNFNLFVFSDLPYTLYAIREEDKDFWKNYTIIDTYKGILLLKHNKEAKNE